MKLKILQSAVLTLALWLSIAGAAMAQAKVVGYVPNWIDINSYANTLDYSKVTHLNIAFENANSSGNLSFNSAGNNLITRAHANNVKVLVSIGGGSASEDANQRNIYFNLISASQRAAFIQKLTAYVTAHNLDGLDIDLEGPAINGDYGDFIRDLANALHPMGKIITAALSEGYGGTNVPTATLQHFDFINIMAYDATGPWNPNAPGQHSSYAYAQNAITYWQGRGLPVAKTVLGVPFYGWGFGAAFRNGDYSYSELVNTYAGAENQDQVGSTIYYNGIPTIKAKTTLALQRGAGVMIWHLAADATGAKSLLLAIDQVIKGSGTDTQAPTAPASLRSTTTSATSVALAWNASTDNVAVTSYEVFRGGVSVGTTASTAFTATGLTANTSYSFTVKAKDAAGNVSAASAALTVTTGTMATNIALNKTVTVSSVEIAGLEGPKAVDGNATTRWSSVQAVDPQWISVDLGASYSVTGVKVTWEAAYATAYQIQISADGSTWNDLKSISGNTALVNDHAGLSGTGRYLRILGTARGTVYGYSIYELEIYGTAAPTSANLALGKTATSSSIEGTGLEASKAVDGNATTTRWASIEAVDPQWLSVDLGASYAISSVRVTWEAAYASTYAIEISTDGSTWNNLKSITGNTALVNNHTGLSGTGRYIRIYGTARGTAWGYSIFELEVYGTAAVQAASIAPLTDASISVYPTLTEDHVTIQLPEGGQHLAVVTVVNAYGRSFISQTVTENKTTLQLSSLPQGQYIIQVISGQAKAVKRIWKK
ncbi:discoidin domain-containing protein [Fulvivirgaceae bacterium PWU5]|uniref:chitinase n=1 Tax=Dawidia cretensis TaxID=2782350 RepID=A0AAP2DYK8_9BACT|nr:discoidin domain-containing protein [Dawidia cretensis]MBT1708422.1 discoidin domain-containing protein [Dawidia cretensis]